MPPLIGLDQWQQFWQFDKPGSVLGKVRFQLADLPRGPTLPKRLNAQDFRVQVDDPSRKDVGANVDQVGPGLPYDQWRKTADYEQWLKETEHKNCNVASWRLQCSRLPRGSVGLG